MPHDGIARITPERLLETRTCELPLPPASRAQAPGSRSEWIPRRHLGRSVVHRERFVVAVRELERVAELDPRDGAARPRVTRELFSLAPSPAEIPLEAEDSDEQAPRRHVFGVGAQALLEQRLCVRVALAIGEQGGLTEDVGLCRTRGEAERYRQDQKAEPERHGLIVVL